MGRREQPSPVIQTLSYGTICYVYARLVAATRRISSVKLVDWQDSGKQKTYDVFHPLRRRTTTNVTRCGSKLGAEISPSNGLHCGGVATPSRINVSSLGSVGVTVTGGGAFPTDGVTRPVPPISETYWIPSI